MDEGDIDLTILDAMLALQREEALNDAFGLAETIAAFPQMCMRADRRSAYLQWDSDIAGALREEAVGAEAPLAAEGLRDAGRFADGAGRAGRFDS